MPAVSRVSVEKEFAWIHDALRIQTGLERAHQVDAACAELLHEKLALAHLSLTLFIRPKFRAGGLMKRGDLQRQGLHIVIVSDANLP